MTAIAPPVWCLITGVSPGGLGDALATELLKRPEIHVIVTGLKTGDLDHLPESKRVVKIQLDVTSSPSISAAVEEVARITGGRLDYLVNNAGYGYMMPLLDADIQAVRHNFEVNVFGLLAVTQACFLLLRKAQGTVVNQCSIASLQAGRQPYIGSYTATKAAVATLNDTMRVEFAPFGIRVRYPWSTCCSIFLSDQEMPWTLTSDHKRLSLSSPGLCRLISGLIHPLQKAVYLHALHMPRLALTCKR